MILPTGEFDLIARSFCRSASVFTLGVVGQEDRCSKVLELGASGKFICQSALMLNIVDPADAFPDYSQPIKKKTEANYGRIKATGVDVEIEQMHLLASEDDMLGLLATVTDQVASDIFLLDISSMPKRFFGFLLRRLLASSSFRNVIVTYTLGGVDGYTNEHLASDPLPCDFLPGFASESSGTLAISVGYEALGIESIPELYYRDLREARVIVPFPPRIVGVRRVWNTIRRFAGGEAANILRQNIEVVATWDTEMTYRILEKWDGERAGLTLAPFGPKPHSLAMVLFGLKYHSGLIYTQPRSYHPDYSTGVGETWAYVVKWDGIPCYERHRAEG